MAKTNNEYWIFLENLRRSGVTNMYGAVPYIQEEFNLDYETAKKVLIDWMKNYNRNDYEEVM